MASHTSTDSKAKHTGSISYPDIDMAIETLRTIISETQALETDGTRFDEPEVENLQKAIIDNIRDIFGADSPEYQEHGHHRIWLGSDIYLESRDKRQEKFLAGIPRTVSLLEGLIRKLEIHNKSLQVEAEIELSSEKPTGKQSAKTAEKSSKPVAGRVCIVHGSDETSKNTLTEFMQKLNLEPVLLNDNKNSKLSLLEKLKTLPEVDYVVVLLSQDDIAPKSSKTGNTHALFELGYLIGTLGKSRVCALYKGNTKLPGELTDITHFPMSDAQVWRRMLGLELKSSGLNVEIQEIH